MRDPYQDLLHSLLYTIQSDVLPFLKKTIIIPWNSRFLGNCSPWEKKTLESSLARVLPL